MKLGQLLSTRADLLPPPYLEALTRLQDKVEPFGFDVVEEVVERGGRRPHLERVPVARPPPPRLGVAGAGAPRRAARRPRRRGEGAAPRHPRADRGGHGGDRARSPSSPTGHSEAGRRLGFADMVAEFRASLMRELDYRQEAANLDRARHPTSRTTS